MSEIEKKWYVLRAISGKEAKVKEYLEADIKNSDLGDYVSQVLIPTEKVYQVRNGKKIVKERSYLPGYVLVEAALVGEVAHHLVSLTRVNAQTYVDIQRSVKLSKRDFLYQLSSFLERVCFPCFNFFCSQLLIFCQFTHSN